MDTNRILLIALLGLFAIIIGCSSGGSNIENIVAPDDNDEKLGVEANGITSIFGLWQVSIDKNAGTIDAVDLRTSDLIINVLGFLEPPPLKGLTIDFATLVINDPIIEVDVILTHPIPDPQFMGFDVRGVVFGPRVANADGTTVIPSPEFFSVVPFGYMDGLLGTPNSAAHYAGLAGYKYFCDGLGKDDDLATFMSNPWNLKHRGVFSQSPKENARHYILDWTSSGKNFFVFNYAVYANYDWPAGIPPYSINDFNISTANGAEAFCCSITELDNSLWYWPGSGGGSISLDVELWDWQGDINGVTVKSVNEGIIPETPGILIGPGTTGCSYMYNFTNVSANPIESGDLDLIITVTDSKVYGEHWFFNLLPVNNLKYGEHIASYFNYVIHIIDFPGNPTDITPPSLNFQPMDVAVDGNYAYIAGNGHGLHIFDISNPLNPTWVNRVDTPGEAWRADITDGYAYVAALNDGLQIIDVNPPESSYIVKTVYTGQAWDVAVSGGYAYVVDISPYSDKLQIIDIDPPESACVVNTVKFPDRPRCVAVSDGYAYVIDESHSFHIIDVDPPESAYIAKTVPMPDELTWWPGIVISGSYAYVAYGHTGMVIIDIDPPELAYIISTIDMPYYAWGVAVSGDYAYVAQGLGGLRIVDINPPETPYVVKDIQTLGESRRVALSGNYVYIASPDEGLLVVDASIPNAADIAGGSYTPGNAGSVAVSEGYCFMTGGSVDLHIMDATNPDSTYYVKQVGTPMGSSADVTVSGDYAYVAHCSEGLKIIDIDPPESAYIVKTVGTPGFAYSVVVSDEYAYVAYGATVGGLAIIDISPPELAYLAKTVDTPGDSACGVAVSGGYAYVVDWGWDDYHCLQIIDVDPVVSSHIVKGVTLEFGSAVAVLDGLVYIAGEGDNNKGLHIVDINPPDSAYLAKTIDLPGSPTDIAVSDGYAYIANVDPGFVIVDIDPLEGAHLIKELESPGGGYASQITVSGGYVYLGDYGLIIFQLW